jgi:DNA-binding PadR family transcriptional regulator
MVVKLPFLFREPERLLVPVKHAVLGLLVERRGYGYELVQRLGDRLGPGWQLNSSAVYAALDQLEADGFIQGRRGQSSGSGDARPPRRDGRLVYDATEAGAEEFDRWIGRPGDQVAPVRSELHLRLAVSRLGDLAAVCRSLEHEEHLLRQVRDAATTTDPEAGHGRPGGWPDEAARIVRDATVQRMQSELDWITTTRAALERALAGTPA